jgi:membrane protease YdiL (CAAX protease family)
MIRNSYKTIMRCRFPWLYVTLAYAIAWSFWIPIALSGRDYQSSPLMLFLMMLGVFGPGLAGIILTYMNGNEEDRRDFWKRMVDIRRIRLRWYLLIVFLWPALQLLSVFLNNLMGGEMPDFKFVTGMLAQPIGIVVVILYFIQAGLEELGWRGYMLERMLPTWGVFKSSLIVGILHAMWHLPLFWIVGTNQIKIGLGFNFLFFVAWVTASSIYSSWCYIDNGRSTLAVTLLHFTANLFLDIFGYQPGTTRFYSYLLLTVLGAVIISGIGMNRKGFANRIPLVPVK